MEQYISQLLDLQTHDSTYARITAALKDIPQEILLSQSRKKKAQLLFDEQKKAFFELEKKRKEIDHKINENEEKIVRLKTQQAQVKKNEEYIALNSELEKTAQEIDSLEFEGLDILDIIEKKKIEIQSLETNLKEELGFIENEINLLKKRESSINDDILKESSIIENLRTSINKTLLSTYDMVKSRVSKAPYIVPLKGQTCSGCYLKVSNEVLKKSFDLTKPHQCDNCGRIVFQEDTP